MCRYSYIVLGKCTHEENFDGDTLESLVDCYQFVNSIEQAKNWIDLMVQIEKEYYQGFITEKHFEIYELGKEVTDE